MVSYSFPIKTTVFVGLSTLSTYGDDKDDTNYATKKNPQILVGGLKLFYFSIYIYIHIITATLAIL